MDDSTKKKEEENTEHSSENKTGETVKLAKETDSTDENTDKDTDKDTESSSLKVQKNCVDHPLSDLTLSEKLNNCNYEWDTFEDDASSESIPFSDEWQDLTKSDYAKVIFCDLYYRPDSGGVGCNFQITDNVHEDPCDYVGLFRVGYDNLSQCLVSKMLSLTECEEDGKLLRCVFASEELPDIEDGYYQFLYVTRDKEICGASMPFEIKQSRSKNHSSDDEVTAEKTDDDFLLVRTGLEKKNNRLEELLAETQEKNRQLNSTIQTLMDEKEHDAEEKQIIIDSLHQEIIASKTENAAIALSITKGNNIISTLSNKITSLTQEISTKDSTIREKDRFIRLLHEQIENVEKVQNKLKQEKQHLSSQIRILESTIKERDAALSSIDQDKLTLLEQLEDQKFMIKALEDSKQLALKEMNDLSESLSRRTKVLNQTRHELASWKEKFQESTTTIEESSKVLKEKKDELSTCYEKFQEFSKAFTEQTEELNKTKAELKANQIKLEESTKTVHKQAKEINKLKAELNENQTKLEYSIEAVHGCTELLNQMNRSSSQERSYANATASELRKALNEKRCEMLACRGKIADINALLKVVSDNGHTTPEEIVISRNALRSTKKKCLKELKETNLQSLKNVQMDDVGYINTLTERINRREPGSLLQVESVPEIDTNLNLKDAMLCVERIINAVKDRLSNADDWSSLIDGYDMEYEELPVELQIELVLLECRKNYQIEILLEHLGKSQDTSQKFHDKISDLQSKITDYENQIRNLKAACAESQTSLTEKENSISMIQAKVIELESSHSLVDNEVSKLKAQCRELQSSITEKDSELSKVRDDYIKKQSLVECLTRERGNLVKKELILQDTVNEHTARLQEAAELYKKQFIEIEKLKKKLKRVRQGSSKMSSVTSEEIPESISEVESARLQFSPEKLRPFRNSSDSDTGEHVLANSSAHQFDGKTSVKTFSSGVCEQVISCLEAYEESHLTALDKTLTSKEHNCASTDIIALEKNCIPTPAETVIPEKGCCFSPPQHLSSSVHFPSLRKEECTTAMKGLSAEDGKQKLAQEQASAKTTEASKSKVSDQESWQKFISEKLGSVKDPSLSQLTFTENHDEEFFSIPCLLCDKNFMVSSKSTSPLLDHLEKHHQLNMCPICGQLFEASFPKVYIMYHINDHFKAV